MKGFTNNLNGRPKGVPNKITLNLRQWISKFLDDNREQLLKDWEQLEPKERIVLFEKLLKYTIPTLASVQVESEYERLPEDQLDKIIDYLKIKQNESTKN